MRQAVLEAGEAGQGQHAPRRGQPLRLGHPAQLEREGHVVERGEPGQEVRLLEDHAHLAGHGAGDGLAVAEHGPDRGPAQARHQREQGGLAAAAGAHHRRELAVRDLEVDPVERGDTRAVGAEAMGDAADRDEGPAHARSRQAPRRASTTRSASFTATAAAATITSAA